MTGESPDTCEVHLRHYGAVFDGTRDECLAYVRRHGLQADSLIFRVRRRVWPDDPFDHGNGD